MSPLISARNVAMDTIGEPFNPRYEACGFHPEEIVARRRDLTDGQKWLYDRMVRWARSSNGERPNERAGEIWRSHENMAMELGKSAKQIGRDIARLEAVHLIAHGKRDGRKSNTYRFLFHASFERTPMSVQNAVAGDFEQTPVTVQTENDPPARLLANGHPRPVKPDLNGHPRPTNQKEFNQETHTPENSGEAEDTEASERPESRQAPRRVLVLHPPPVDWQSCGWEGPEDFECWWSRIVQGHPNKFRNGAARTKAVELIMAGQLRRLDFERGLAGLATANADRWAEQRGRFATNLWQILDDGLWKFTAPSMPPAAEYQSAEDYLRRVENE